jgi:hypothetical protein
MCHATLLCRNNDRFRMLEEYWQNTHIKPPCGVIPANIPQPE